MRRVVFISGVGDYSGANRIGLGYAEAMTRDQENWEVEYWVLAGRDEGEALAARFPSLRVTTWPSSRSFDGRFRRVLCALVKRPPDILVSVVQVDVKFTLVVGALTGCRIIVLAQNRHTFSGGPTSRWLRGRAYGWLVARYADVVVCVGTGVRHEIARLTGLPSRLHGVLPNGIELDVAQQLTKQLFDPRGCKVRRLVMVGRWDWQKGQDLMLEALRILRADGFQLSLDIIGDATAGSATAREFRRYLEASYAGLYNEGLVRCLGWVDEPRQLLRNYDAFVLPSRWEGPAFCIAALEALAEGVPVAITDCGGVDSEFIERKCGIVFRPNDVGALVGALRQLLRMDGEALSAMGERGREYCARWLSAASSRRRWVEFVQQAPMWRKVI